MEESTHNPFKELELEAVYSAHDKGPTHVLYTPLVTTLTYCIVIWRTLVSAVMNIRVP